VVRSGHGWAALSGLFGFIASTTQGVALGFRWVAPLALGFGLVLLHPQPKALPGSCRAARLALDFGRSHVPD
jgi:hypothetical protein